MYVLKQKAFRRFFLCSKASDNISEDLILLGDFNLPNMDLDTMTGSIPQFTDFCDFLLELNLEQLVTTPTNIAGNILDVILMNTATIKLSHHFLVDCPLITT